MTRRRPEPIRIVMTRVRLTTVSHTALLLAACAPSAAPPPATAPATGAEVTGAAAEAAAPPATDVFLLELVERDGELGLGAGTDAAPRVRNLTDRAGYDNQPMFSADGRLVLYTSIRDDGQADIYRYDLATGTTERVTRTQESEYSPTPTPDGAGISVVRVEADSTQRLWRFDRGGAQARLVLPDVAPVGYHAWGDDHTLALFVLGSPPTLRIADTRTGRAVAVAEDIGRSLHRVPGRRAISFVFKAHQDDWWIRVLDLDTRRIDPLAPTLPGAEDHAWTPGGTLLMGSGSVLYRWDADGREWVEVADLAGAGLRAITRLAVSPHGDRVAVVAERG